MAGLSKALNIVNGWILDIVCHVVWTSFKTNGTCEETAYCRDLIQGVMGRPKPEEHQPMCDLKERLLVLLTRLEDGQQPTKFWYDLETTILEDAVDHLEAIKINVRNMELNKDISLLLDSTLELGLKQQAVYVCCSANEFERASEVFKRYWDSPETKQEKLLSKQIKTVINSKKPKHQLIKSCPYSDFLEQMKAGLGVIFDCFETPFLIKAAEKVLNRLDVQERCSKPIAPDAAPESPRPSSPSLLKDLEFDLEACSRAMRASAGKLTGPTQRRLLEDFDIADKKGNSLNLKGEEKSRSENELQKIWENKNTHIEQIRKEFPDKFIKNGLEPSSNHDVEQDLSANDVEQYLSANDIDQVSSAKECDLPDLNGCSGDHVNEDNNSTSNTTRKKQEQYSPRKKTPDKYFKKVTRDTMQANHNLDSALRKFKRNMRSRNASEESEEIESTRKRTHTNCADTESIRKRTDTNCEDTESTKKKKVPTATLR